MGLGVLDVKNEHVPGTVWVYETESRRIAADQHEIETGTRGLKVDRSGKEPVILVPQPSDDPNDPLNWPLWKRDSILALLCVISVLASSLSSIMAADSLVFLFNYRPSDFNKIAQLTGWHLLSVGVSGFFFVASARIWGKRHLYLLGNVFIIIGTAWAGSSGRSFKSMVWARVFQGIGVAPFEALVNASVGDLYFVHERGLRMAISNMALFGGGFFTPVVTGKIAHELGWKWTFYFVTIFSGITLPLVFLFMPETAYRRPDSLNTDMVGDSTNSSSTQVAVDGEQGSLEDVGKERATSSEADEAAPQIPQKQTFLQSLKLFNGRKSDDKFIDVLVRPLPLFAHPAVLWACLTQGTLIGWTVMIGVVLAALFIGPPLWFTEVRTGYLYTGPFIGAVLGFILSGVVSDWSARLMIKWNKGVFEPEFRIILVLPQLIFGAIGLYGFGYSTNVLSGWQLPVVFFGFEVGGMVIGAVASALYVVDGYRDLAIEAFTCMLVFKNVFSFGMTIRSYDWLVAGGPKYIFNIISSIQVGICLLSIPMYIFGKKIRAAMSKFRLFRTR